MAELMLPRSLRQGSRVAVYTPSHPAPALYPKRFARGVAALRQLGFEVHVPEPATRIDGYTSGTPEARAAALMEIYRDDAIDAVICTIGGFNSNGMLNHLDYDTIRRHPKVLVGNSDATALLMAILARTGTVTFHGPAILPEWGEFPAPLDYTRDCFLAVTGGRAPYSFHVPPRWTNEFLDWGTGADNRPRRDHAHEGWRVVHPGRARGPLLGGNLETVNALVGSPFCPGFEGALLFVEATEAEAYLPRFERALAHLELAGLLGAVRALLVARCPDAAPERGVSLYDLVGRVGKRYDIPVVADLDFGHTDPQMTLPLGVEAELLAAEGGVSLRLLSPATRLDGEPRP